MKKYVFVWILFLLVGMLSGLGEAQESGDLQGSLVIVGGAFTSSNEAVYKAFIERAGEGMIGVVPAASGKPIKYSKQFLEDLERWGVEPGRGVILPLAVKDDKSTEDQDESLWKDNGDDPQVIETIEKCSAIWFIGGDQTRIAQVLLKEDGAPTKALEALRGIYAKGGVLGGTSAGAAIMSDVMITGGNSMGALMEGFTEEYGSMEDQEYGPVSVAPGLGFFPWGVIDQHFDRKARLGRLVVVNLAHQENFPLGFGIDEDTAMVVDAAKKSFTVAGPGCVTVVDVSEATAEGEGKARAIHDVRLHLLAEGDLYDLASGEIAIEGSKVTTRGYEYMNVPDPDVTGSFSSNALVRHALTFGLVDNKAVEALKTYCFNQNGEGFVLTFRKIPEVTEGYWGYLNGLKDSYSATDILMDVEPVTVTIAPR